MNEFCCRTTAKRAADTFEPDDAAMAKIEKYTLRKYDPKELFVFRMVACDNEIDRDTERFSVDSLGQLAKLLVGKPMICDHEWSAENQTARIYDTAVEQSGNQKTSDGMPYTRLILCCYMPKNAQNAPRIAQIEAGIQKEVSVGCRAEKSICSICGKDYYSKDCTHEKGRRYEHSSCFVSLEKITDAYEVSFVAVPAQRRAGVTKGLEYGSLEKEIESLCSMVKQTAQRVKTLEHLLHQATPAQEESLPEMLEIKQLISSAYALVTKNERGTIK